MDELDAKQIQVLFKNLIEDTHDRVRLCEIFDISNGSISNVLNGKPGTELLKTINKTLNEEFGKSVTEDTDNQLVDLLKNEIDSKKAVLNRHLTGSYFGHYIRATGEKIGKFLLIIDTVQTKTSHNSKIRIKYENVVHLLSRVTYKKGTWAKQRDGNVYMYLKSPKNSDDLHNEFLIVSDVQNRDSDLRSLDGLAGIALWSNNSHKPTSSKFILFKSDVSVKLLDKIRPSILKNHPRREPPSVSIENLLSDDKDVSDDVKKRLISFFNSPGMPEAAKAFFEQNSCNVIQINDYL